MYIAQTNILKGCLVITNSKLKAYEEIYDLCDHTVLLLSTSVLEIPLPAMYRQLSRKCIPKQTALPGHKMTDIIAPIL